jgi:hypothetical protein
LKFASDWDRDEGKFTIQQMAMMIHDSWKRTERFVDKLVRHGYIDLTDIFQTGPRVFRKYKINKKGLRINQDVQPIRHLFEVGNLNNCDDLESLVDPLVDNLE